MAVNQWQRLKTVTSQAVRMQLDSLYKDIADEIVESLGIEEEPVKEKPKPKPKTEKRFSTPGPVSVVSQTNLSDLLFKHVEKQLGHGYRIYIDRDVCRLETVLRIVYNKVGPGDKVIYVQQSVDFCFQTEETLYFILDDMILKIKDMVRDYKFEQLQLEHLE